MKQQRMTPAEWANVPDNPIQRDTEKHAKKAQTRHLSKPAPSHCRTALAELPNGKRFKLDGHTRSFLWESGHLAAPEWVYADVYEVAGVNEAIELYKHFDNASAAENATDRLTGAYRLQGIFPISRLLTQGGVTSAFQLIEGKQPIYESVKKWEKELLLLDSLDLQPERMPASLITAALLTVRRHPKKAPMFWELFSEDKGTRSGGKSCGVDELSRIVADARARRLLSSGRYANRASLAGRAISCCESWVSGRGYTTGAKTTDLRAYIEKVATEHGGRHET